MQFSLDDIYLVFNSVGEPTFYSVSFTFGNVFKFCLVMVVNSNKQILHAQILHALFVHTFHLISLKEPHITSGQINTKHKISH